MSPLTIRDADPERDAAACAAIYAPSVEGSPTSFEERPPDTVEMAARIESCAASHAWLVAEEGGGGGGVVGYAYAAPFSQRPAYRWSASVSVYIAAGRRGEGIGRALYAELLERLRRQGLRTACAGITLPNPASVGLHEALGFTPVGVYRGIGWKEGAWRDVGWWQLELVPEPAGRPREPTPPASPPGVGEPAG